MLAPEAPYPLAGGGALRTASLLQYLARGYETDLIVFRQPGADDPRAHLPAGLVRRVGVIDLPAHGRSMPARVMRNLGRVARSVPPLVDRFSGFAEEIARNLTGRKYELGVIEHFWCAEYQREMAKVCEKTVLNLHNIESVLHERCAASESMASGMAHRVFGEASREREREWLPRFTTVLTASEADARVAQEIAPEARVTVYANAIPQVSLPERHEDFAIVFSGNMEYHPNQGAVRYFRREIWPRLREQWTGLVWRLVGKNADAVRALVEGDPRIELTGEVDDAVQELAKAQVAVVPLLAGSGTRLKILEAWAAGTPVVSTTVGAEGLQATNGEHLLLADDPAGFAEAVSRLLGCKEKRDSLGMAGRLLMEKEFTWEIAWQNLAF